LSGNSSILKEATSVATKLEDMASLYEDIYAEYCGKKLQLLLIYSTAKQVQRLIGN
jgi:hypothetical protein